ncbi:MAG: hypothetical protein AAGF50_01655, partial [Pseudomonadota bacterium]
PPSSPPGVRSAYSISIVVARSWLLSANRFEFNFRSWLGLWVPEASSKRKMPLRGMGPMTYATLAGNRSNTPPQIPAGKKSACIIEKGNLLDAVG